MEKWLDKYIPSKAQNGYTTGDKVKYSTPEYKEAYNKEEIDLKIKKFQKEFKTKTTHKQKNGGVTKDDNGYWNPDNWGKPVEIGSNDITMKGVNQDLIGVSDEGDVQYMTPGNDYKFKGKKVTEFPINKNGGWLDNI